MNPNSLRNLRRGGSTGRKKGVPNKATANLKAAAQVYSREALETLADVMRDEKAPPQARVSASNALLDRGYGKPPQALTDGDGGPLIPPKVIHEHVAG